MLTNYTYECYRIVKACRSKGIELSVENARIKVSGNTARLDGDMLATLKDRRSELIRFLVDEEEMAARYRDGVTTLTASDFPWSSLSADLLNTPHVQHALTENLYIATPTQAGLLFHGLLDGSGASYTSVTSCDLAGVLDVQAFKQAWAYIIRRHQVFRTCFIGLQEEQIHQLVRREVDLPFLEMDWRDRPAGEQAAALEQLRKEDKARGFNFTQAPLMRLTLIRLADKCHHFIWSHHHTLMDGWCLPVVFKEVLLAYRAFALGTAQPQLSQAVPYVNYIAWLYRQDKDEARAFWREQLSGISAPTPLIIGTDGAAQASGVSRTQILELAKDTTTKLRALAKTTHTTMSTVVQAAWAILLQRYCGEPEIVFGATVSGRPAQLPGIEQMIGLFINTLPVRVRFASDLTLQGLLRQLHENGVVGEEYGYLGLAEIQQLSEVPNGVALFDSVVVFENYPTALSQAQDASDIEVRSVRSDDHTNYALTLIVRSQERLSVDVDYWSDSIADACIARLIGHLQQILTCMADRGAEQPVKALDVLTNGEQVALAQWNATQAQFPHQRCIHEFFEEQAAQLPDATAIVFEGQHLSYGELNRRSNRLAHYLIEQGVGPDSLVGLCMERAPEMLVGILGILKAGGAYVPLDPEYPAARLEFMCTDIAARIVVTQRALTSVVPQAVHGAICLDEDECQAMLRGFSDANPGHRDLRSDHLVYVLYTSGSTGNPKGVMVEHRALVNRLHWMQQRYPLERSDRVLQKTPYSFDVSVWELLWPLTVGAQVVFARPGGHKEPLLLRDVIQQHAVTTMHYVPSMLRAMLDAVDLAECGSLRRVFCSGEALARDLVHDYFEQVGPQCELHNLYGPTEAAIDVSYWDCRDYGLIECIPIGRPISNIRLHVLNEHLQAQPVGVPGELYIGGVGLARGYLNQPALTTSKFLRDPFHDDTAQRLYKTGDLARWLPDGNLEYLRRIDEQVKIRGFRIELGEIEHCLTRVAGIKETAVACREGEDGEKRLVAYVVCSESLPENDAEALAQQQRTLVTRWQDELRATLPEYMVPAIFVILAALPLSRNGKLDRKALPAPEESDLRKQAYVAPRNETEAKLCAIWQQVLQLEQVGVHDSFFALGGHSLLAVRLVTRIQDQLKQTVALKQLFLTPTIAGIAAYLHEQRGEAGEVLPRITVDVAARHESFALTGVQQAYLMGRSNVFSLGNVSAHGYHEFNLPELDVERLGRAWNRFIRRHGMMRTVFSQEGTQRILREVPDYEIAYEDLSAQSEQGRAQRLSQIRDELSHQVFAVERWPLFEVRVTRLATSHYRLHYSMDLLLVDGSSARLLAKEMLALYVDPQSELAALELTFRDYVQAEQAIQGLPIYSKSREYWLGRLETLPMAPALPLAKDPGQIREPKFKRRQFRLEASAWRALKGRINEVGVTPTVFLLTVFSQVLARWSKSDRFTLNLTLFNRLPLHEQVDLLIGDFTSLTLLEIGASSQHSLAHNARSIQEQLWSDLEYRHFGGVEVLRALNRRSGSHQAVSMPVVFTSALGLEGNGAQHAKLLESPLRAQDYGITQTSQIWLDHVAREEKGALLLHWDAIEELFPAGVLDEMFVAYRELVEGLATREVSWEACYRPELPAAQRAQRQVVNATEVPRAEQSLHGLFMEQVGARAQHPAIVTAERQLSYAQVDRMARGVAQQLRALGAQRNTLVGVVMEKGWEQVVGVLGVLYAGAAYLPIDAGLPSARIDELLSLGQVRIAVTQPWLQGPLSWPPAVQVIEVREQLAQQALDSDVPAQPAPTDLAYVIFTSGSTGQPKGVMIDHRGAVNTILDINAKFAVGPQDRVLALSSLSFDLSVYDVFGLLAAGGTIVLPQASKEKDPAHWVERVAGAGVTIWNTVPALAQLYVEQAHKTGQGRSVRLFLLSGDWIALTLPQQLWASSPAAQVISLGGATEASIWSIYYPVQEVGPEWRSIPYGWPLENQRWHVLKADYSDCPQWAIGDLYIGGVGLAQGYWQDERKTNASFIVHPHSAERLYKTGDLGRYLPDGTIEFLGREDTQVKVHGHRIELGEIEAALTQHEQIKDAIVLALGEDRHHKTLVAYVQPVQRAAAADEAELIEQEDDKELLRQPHERAMFKLEQVGLRRVVATLPSSELPGKAQLHSPLLLDGAALQYPPGQLREGVSLQVLGQWLSCLGQVDVAGHPLPKRYYPSAGSLYPLQTYIYVRAEAVAGIAGGFYYYDPSGHRLVRLNSMVQADEPALLHGLPLALFLVADTRAMRPLYGAQTPRFCLLEAGHMQQLLVASGACHGIGMAGVGEEATPWMREGFELTDDHVLMQCLAAGRVEQAAQRPGAMESLSRQSYRTYLPGGVSRRAIEEWLNALCWSGSDPQVYLYSKAQQVQGLAEGFYCYAPAQGTLQAVSEPHAAQLRCNSGSGVNATVYGGSAFSLYLVGESALAAGHLGQALMNTAVQAGIGLCPIGSLAFARTAEGQPLLYSFEAGAISVEQTRQWPLQQAPQSAQVEQQLRDHLSLRLPAYMVPSVYLVMEKFPLSANGKVDRKALPRPQQGDLPARVYVAPRNETEAKLCAIWQQVLQLEQVGVHDNFFEMGGNSMLAIRVMNLIRERFEHQYTELSLIYLFRNPFPAKLAEILTVQTNLQDLEKSRLATAQLAAEEMELGEV